MKKKVEKILLYFVIFEALLLFILIVRKVAIGGGKKSVEYEVSASHKWDKLLLVLNQIEKNYVDTINYKDMVEEIIPVVLEKLDPHSIYLPPVELQKAEEPLSGNFSGIGVQFNVPNDTAIVISVISGGPSEKVGILSGDRIMKVNGRVVAGVKFNQDSLVRLLRGPDGTMVNIDVKRDDLKELLPFAIERGKIPIKSLDVAFMLNDSIGYVKLSQFSRTTYPEFLKAVSSLLGNGMKSLVLDLRDNSGGYLDQALMISNEFLEKDNLVVYMEGLNRKREEFKANGKGMLKDIDLTILINEGSASSSEIVAGAIQDNDRGTIIGRRSFGKGLVQEPIYFSDKSGVRLTIARYYTPTGRCIQKPYSPDYKYDILERFKHGEFMVADSIKLNDSLKYTTPKGKIVYGGGGIMPDIFVPMDTVGVTDFLVNVNRRSLVIKYSNLLSDRYRKDLREVKTMDDLNNLFKKIDFGGGFLAYSQKNGVVPKGREWEVSKLVIIQQLKGLVGRYTVLDDNGFYPYILEIDNVIDVVKERYGIKK